MGLLSGKFWMPGNGIRLVLTALGVVEGIHGFIAQQTSESRTAPGARLGPTIDATGESRPVLGAPESL